MVNTEIRPDSGFNWNSETEYAEPQAWYYLADGTSVEICYEMEGLPSSEHFYSLRRHCSEDDFDNDVYHSTCGVIEEYAGDAEEIKRILNRILNEINEVK